MEVHLRGGTAPPRGLKGPEAEESWGGRGGVRPETTTKRNYFIQQDKGSIKHEMKVKDDEKREWIEGRLIHTKRKRKNEKRERKERGCKRERNKGGEG